MRILSFSCLAFSLLLSSCKKNDGLNNSGSNPASAANFNQVFESFWNGVNKNYLYWDIDTTNWDKIYYRYKPLFEGLDLNNQADVAKSVSYFKQMTSGLTDSHFQILGLKGNFEGLNIFPAEDKKKALINYHDRYDYSKIDAKYFDNSETAVHGTLNVKTATIHNKITYFSCNEFSLASAYYNNRSVHALIDLFFKKATEDVTNTSGVIIDLRNNFGGDLVDLNFLVGHLITTPLDFGFSRYKSNFGRLDYTPWIKATATPVANSRKINCPVIILVDNYTVSVAEAVAMCMRLLPNSSIIGEQTWGATGPLAESEIFNGGPFQVGNILSIRTSSAEFKYIDGKMYEGMGFPPDIVVPFDIQLVSKEVDLQLEKAISLLK